MHVFFLVLCCLSSVVCFADEAVEYIRNADFESTHFAGNWICADCTMTSYTSDVYHGSKCIKVTNRHHFWSAPQTITHVTPGHNYVAKMHFKLLNMESGSTTVEVDLMATVHTHGRDHRVKVARLPYQQLRYGWSEISGDFFVPAGSTTVKLFLQVAKPSINYLLDYCSLQQIPHNPHWYSDAATRIASLRKAPVSLRIAHGTNAEGITVQLVQKRHEFPFGTAVRAALLIDGLHQDYANFIYHNFNWAVLENILKWRLMEWTQGHPKFDTAEKAISTLRSHGLPVRGHNMFWATDGHSPNWLGGKSQSDFITEMKRHISDVVSHTNGTLDHWDVYNEALHGRYYEEHSGDPDIINKMFNWIHVAEPQSKLFLNDFNIVNSNMYTTALKNQGLQLLKDGIPVDGIGIQSHFHGSNIDMDVLKYRLDKVAEAGLKLWITELTILESNSTKKAAALEDVLTLYYSHPAVEGIMLWGFWDGAAFDTRISLFTGSKITANAAGQKYLDLVRNTWWTQYSHDLTAGQILHTSVFSGSYTLVVKHNGNIIHQENLVIDTTGKDIAVHVTDDHHVSQIAFG
ncbi:anti-sigma-I factor RsgI6-like [Ostrea edulis]|uniref:anti-sigma-I factor RsgI6-like n=1 Tax=Ostrea edulis TaxID=37623 RepID=UPI0024AED61C|nr:anti-sigma-I factor RsgI6-like [Ostrea edulis]